MSPVERVIEIALRDWAKRTELSKPGYTLAVFIANALRREGLIDSRAEFDGTIIPDSWLIPGALTLVTDDVTGKPAPKPGPPGKPNPAPSVVPAPKPRPKPGPRPAPAPKPQPPKK